MPEGIAGLVAYNFENGGWTRMNVDMHCNRRFYLVEMASAHERDSGLVQTFQTDVYLRFDSYVSANWISVQIWPALPF